MGGIVIGILFMFQPVTQSLYSIGFTLLLVSLLLFIAVSHITPRREAAEEED
jgi:ABC-type phosphate transport system permease subunit